MGIDELGENWMVRVTMITITMVVTMMEAREKVEKKDECDEGWGGCAVRYGDIGDGLFGVFFA